MPPPSSPSHRWNEGARIDVLILKTRSQHSTLPLHTLEEYQQLCHASQDDDKEEMEQAQDAHAVMLKRLQFELDERIR